VEGTSEVRSRSYASTLEPARQAERIRWTSVAFGLALGGLALAVVAGVANRGLGPLDVALGLLIGATGLAALLQTASPASSASSPGRPRPTRSSVPSRPSLRT
jgi:hypothetical protein